MSYRLQVLLNEDEIRAVRAAAGRARVTVSEFVRRALREATSSGPASGVAEKLLVVREAAAHSYPTADPAAMDAEIIRGYLKGLPSEGED